MLYLPLRGFLRRTYCWSARKKIALCARCIYYITLRAGLSTGNLYKIVFCEWRWFIKEEKSTVPVLFSILCPCAGRRINGVHGVNSVRRRPFMNSRLAVGGLALEGSDKQRCSLSRPLGRTEILFNQRWNLNFQISLTAVCSEHTLWTDLHCTLSLPNDMNAGKPLYV